MTSLELVIHLRSKPTLKGEPMAELASWLQALGRSGRGSRDELETRLTQEIWRAQWGHLIDRHKG